jgi:CRP-like cAMP-binding protein
MKDSFRILFKDSKLLNIPQSKIVIYEGHEVNKVYYIVSGYIKVYAIVGANIQRVPFIYRSGDIFPLTTFLADVGVARFFYEAMTDVKVYCITPKHLEKKLIGNLELAEDLIKFSDKTDKQFVQRVNDLISIGNPRAKVKNLLLFLAQAENSREPHIALEIKLSAKDIAGLCGISREEALKQLKFLKSSAIIANSGNTVIDRQKLLTLKTY